MVRYGEVVLRTVLIDFWLLRGVVLWGFAVSPAGSGCTAS
jgi:hypothetical protein